MKVAKVTIVGAGAMGSALTFPLASNREKKEVALLGSEYDTPIIERLRKGEKHPALGVALPDNVRPYTWAEKDEALNGSDAVVLVTSSEGLPNVSKQLAPYLRDKPVIIATKGLHEEKGRILTMSEVVAETIGADNIVSLSGPSIARQVAEKKKTVVLGASKNPKALQAFIRYFQTPEYIIVPSTDVRGSEICAAVKNPLAIASGMCADSNESAAVFVYALNEMRRIATDLGGSAETVDGLAGVGDLKVTCQYGRNSEYGALLAKGMRPEQALEEMKKAGKTVEGYSNTPLVYKLIKKLPGPFPLLEAVYDVVMNGANVRTALDKVHAYYAKA